MTFQVLITSQCISYACSSGYNETGLSVDDREFMDLIDKSFQIKMDVRKHLSYSEIPSYYQTIEFKHISVLKCCM